MAEKKNILFFIGTLGGGGAERVLTGLLKHLDRKKYRLSLVINRPGGEFFDDIPDDVEVIDRSQIRRSYFDLGDRVFGLSRIVRNRGIDLVISFLTGANRSLMRSRFFMNSTVRLIIREGNNPHHIQQHYSGWFWRKVANLEVRWLYPGCDRLIAASEGVKQVYSLQLGIDEARIEMIPNMVDLDALRSGANRPVELPWELDENGEVKLLVAVGRLTRQKGYEDMIDVLRLVRRQVDARLMILGRGPQREAIQKRVDEYGLSDAVWIPGFVDNPWAYMSRADLYLSTSYWEGFHLTIVEAMACGVVPVATDCNFGPSEIITDGVDGQLVPVGDVETIASEVVRLLADGNRRKKMAVQAKKRAMDFDVSVIVHRYEKLFDHLLETTKVSKQESGRGTKQHPKKGTNLGTKVTHIRMSMRRIFFRIRRTTATLPFQLRYRISLVMKAPLETQAALLHAPAVPDLLWTSRSNIVYHGSLPNHPVGNWSLGGDWDRTRIESLPSVFEQVSEQSYSWIEHETVRILFLKNGNYRDTPQYRFMLDLLEQDAGATPQGCRTVDEVEVYFQRMMDAFEPMKSDGYRTQAELGNTPDNEVRLYLTREGQLCLGTGVKHRVRMAEILDIEWIPFILRGIQTDFVTEVSAGYGLPPHQAVKHWIDDSDLIYRNRPDA